MKENSKNQVSEPQESQHDFMGRLVTYQVSEETNEVIEYLYRIRDFKDDTERFLKKFEEYLIPGEENIQNPVLDKLSLIAGRIIGDKVIDNFNLDNVANGVVIL